MINIFISYRRQDSAGHAGRLFDHLQARYGNSSVFMDVARIELGVDFIEAINQAISACDVLLAVMGHEWLSCGDGLNRRIDNPNDFIRLELISAFNREMTVIPVLVEDARTPSAGELPNDLQPLASLRGFELRDAYWESDVRGLMAKLDEFGSPTLKLANASIVRRRLLYYAAILGVGIAAAIIGNQGEFLTRPIAQPAGFIPPKNLWTIGPVATLSLPGNSQGAKFLAPLPLNLLAVASMDEIFLWNPTTNQIEASFKLSGEIMAVSQLADGRLALAGRDGGITLWNPKTGKTELTLSGPIEVLTALAPMSNGLLAAGGWDNSIEIWNIATAKIKETLAGHTNHIRALATLRDGRLVSGSADGSIKLWNLETNAIKVKTFKDLDKPVNALAVLAEDRLASGTDDGTVNLWNLTTGKVEARLVGHHDWVNAILPLPKDRLVSGSDDASIILWDLATGKPLAILEGHNAKVTSLALLKDGRLASAAEDDSIKLWDIDLAPFNTALKP